MYNHMNARNGDKAPLVSDELYKVVMEVRCWVMCPRRSPSNMTCAAGGLQPWSNPLCMTATQHAATLLYSLVLWGCITTAASIASCASPLQLTCILHIAAPTHPFPPRPSPQNAERLDSEIIYDRDFDYDYFGFKVGQGWPSEHGPFESRGTMLAGAPVGTQSCVGAVCAEGPLQQKLACQLASRS
jgi:hypothetical protein